MGKLFTSILNAQIEHFFLTTFKNFIQILNNNGKHKFLKCHKSYTKVPETNIHKSNRNKHTQKCQKLTYTKVSETNINKIVLFVLFLQKYKKNSQKIIDEKYYDTNTIFGFIS